MLRWLFLDMNLFFASVEQQEHPELRGRPVAVVPMDSDTTCCIAASYEAKAFGIRTGTNVGEAKRLCPGLILVEAKHGPYRDYHNRIVEAVSGCTPIEKVLSVDEMTCRLWANDRTVDDAKALGLKVKEAIHSQVGEHLHCSVGLSVNPFLAKVAAELQKPNGLVVIDDIDLPHALYSLELRDFPGINRAMNARFNAYGVMTTQQMYALSCSEMCAIYGGIGGERWWRLLRGEEVWLPDNPRRTVGHSHVMPPELRTPSGAWAVAGRLLVKAAERMRFFGLHARSLGVHVRGQGRAKSWEAHTRFSPSSDTWTLMNALRRCWHHPFAQPMKVGVVLGDLVPDNDVVPTLFGDKERLDRVTTAIDHLNRTFGRGTVTLASVLPAAQTAHDTIAFGKVAEMG